MGFLDKAKAQATAAMAQGQAKVGAMQSNRSEGELYRALGEATYAAQRRGGAPDAVDAAIGALDAHFAQLAQQAAAAPPPAGWQDEDYQLTSRDYVRMIVQVADALGLDRPVAMGCSIGGRIVLHLAHECPERFRALIGLESAAHTDPYYDLSWLNRPDVHGGMVCAGVVSGLMAPTAPAAEKWETLWHYMQSGPGVFKGDLHFYMIDGDIRGRVDDIDIKRCPLFLLTGEYDYSCTAEATLDIAKRTGAPATIMKGLGHFPMSEDPAKFVSYLLPVLEKIRAL